MAFTIQFICAVFLDLLAGDPRTLPHPVRIIGLLCNRIEQFTRAVFGNAMLAGMLTVLLVITSTLGFLTALLAGLHQLSALAEVIVAVLLLYTSIACRDLQRHSKDVYDALVLQNDLPSARKLLSRIVGRDTRQLDSQGVSRACVETVAENLVDGITAPLFYAVVFSLLPLGELLSPISCAVLGAYSYKTINTMDSMFGYKNQTYIDFGKVAARVDDLANFLPARITPVFIVIAAFCLGLNGANCWQIFKRDRLQHSSPNAGHPEAAVAGALGVQLGGDSIYFGQVVSKPVIGEPVRALDAEDILKTNRLMLATALLFCMCMLSVRHLIVLGG